MPEETVRAFESNVESLPQEEQNALAEKMDISADSEHLSADITSELRSQAKEQGVNLLHLYEHNLQELRAANKSVDSPPVSVEISPPPAADAPSTAPDVTVTPSPAADMSPVEPKIEVAPESPPAPSTDKKDPTPPPVETVEVEPVAIRDDKKEIVEALQTALASADMGSASSTTITNNNIYHQPKSVEEQRAEVRRNIGMPTVTT